MFVVSIDLCVWSVVQALEVIGLKPTEAQQQALQSRLRADPAGTVAFTGKTSPVWVRVRVRADPAGTVAFTGKTSPVCQGKRLNWSYFRVLVPDYLRFVLICSSSRLLPGLRLSNRKFLSTHSPEHPFYLREFSA